MPTCLGLVHGERCKLCLKETKRQVWSTAQRLTALLGGWGKGEGVEKDCVGGDVVRPEFLRDQMVNFLSRGS